MTTHNATTCGFCGATDRAIAHTNAIAAAFVSLSDELDPTYRDEGIRTDPRLAVIQDALDPLPAELDPAAHTYPDDGSHRFTLAQVNACERCRAHYSTLRGCACDPARAIYNHDAQGCEGARGLVTSPDNDPLAAILYAAHATLAAWELDDRRRAPTMSHDLERGMGALRDALRAYD